MTTESKFKLGQKVFVMYNNTPVMNTVAAITETNDRWLYYLTNSTTYDRLTYMYEKKKDHVTTHSEHTIFASLDDLKQSLFGGE